MAFDSMVIFMSFFLSLASNVGDAMGVVDVMGELLCELLVSNDNGDASFAGVSFLSLSLIDCDRTNVLSSQATTLCSSSSSSISVDMLSGSAMGEKRKKKKNHFYSLLFRCTHSCCCSVIIGYFKIECTVLKTFMAAIKFSDRK